MFYLSAHLRQTLLALALHTTFFAQNCHLVWLHWCVDRLFLCFVVLVPALFHHPNSLLPDFRISDFIVQPSQSTPPLFSQYPFANADWESWWTYEGISGPDFWGRLNPKWSHCSKGHRQSPIDIDTKLLLYDPNLEPVRMNGDNVKGQLTNTGRGISMSIKPDKSVHFSDGPFSYSYTLSNISLHFGRENNRGSEHTIDQMQFPGELQMYAYNSQLYANWSEAKREPNGIAAISVFIVLAKNSNQANPALKQITSSLKNITRRGQMHTIESISILELLPTLRHYVTYEGSLTQPACHETVQWVILNKPIYISSYQFHMLRHSLKGDGHQDNFRPTQLLNKRPLRSNIANEQAGNHQQQHPNMQSQPQSDATVQRTNNDNLSKNFHQHQQSVEFGSNFGISLEPSVEFALDDKEDFGGYGDGYHRITSRSSWSSAIDHSMGDEASSPEAIMQQLTGASKSSVCGGEQIRLYGYKDGTVTHHGDMHVSHRESSFCSELQP